MRQGKEHPGKPAVTRAGRDKKQVLPGSPPGTAALPTSSFPANEDDFGLLASGTMKEWICAVLGNRGCGDYCSGHRKWICHSAHQNSRKHTPRATFTSRDPGGKPLPHAEKETKMQTKTPRRAGKKSIKVSGKLIELFLKWLNMHQTFFLHHEKQRMDSSVIKYTGYAT